MLPFSTESSCGIACIFADGLLLSLEQLLEDLPALQQYKEAGQPDWTFITPVVSNTAAAAAAVIVTAAAAWRWKEQQQLGAHGTA